MGNRGGSVRKWLRSSSEAGRRRRARANVNADLPPESSEGPVSVDLTHNYLGNSITAPILNANSRYWILAFGPAYWYYAAGESGTGSASEWYAWNTTGTFTMSSIDIVSNFQTPIPAGGLQMRVAMESVPEPGIWAAGSAWGQQRFPRATEAHQRMDYVFGVWEVRQGGKVAGFAQFTRSAMDCAIVEDWLSTDGK